MSVRLGFVSKESLSETLDIGNTTNDGQSIDSLNGGSSINLRAFGTDNFILIENDNLGFTKGIFQMTDSISALLHSGTYGFQAGTFEARLLTSPSSFGFIGFATMGLRNEANFSNVTTDAILVRDVSTAAKTSASGGANALFLNSGFAAAELDTFNLGVLRSVAVGGKGKTIKTNDTAYVNQISFQESGIGFDCILKSGTITTDRVLTLPDKDGELVVAEWQPSEIALGSLLVSGATFFINPGAGVYLSMPGGSDSTFFFNDCLSNGSGDYDGSDLVLVLKGRISSNGSPGDTVGLILNYGIVGNGDNSATTVTTVPQQNVDVSGELQDIQFEVTLATMTGVSGANTIMVDVSRNAAGAGSDTYAGSFEITSLMFMKT